MARDNWNYIRIDFLLPSNPKLSGLNLAQKWLLIGAWCYCGEHLTDGFIPAPIWRKLGRPRDRQALLDLGCAEEVPGGVNMHDYLEHQRSRAEVEDVKRKRAAAGARGGRAKANRVASATASGVASGVASASGFATNRASKNVAEAEADKELMVDVVTRTNGQLPREALNELIISELRLRYGRTVSQDWAAKIAADILRGQRIHDPLAYVRQVIRAEPDPRRFLQPAAPAYTRSAAQAIAESLKREDAE